MLRLIIVGLVAGLLVNGTGCSNSPPPPAPVTTAVVKEAVPGRIEITDASVRIDQDSVARIQVKYKFVEGEPTKFYQCTFKFPGTEKFAIKPLDSWEMKKEGVINTGTEVNGYDVNEFSIQFSEADSPEQGYTVNSNVFTGKVSK